ncbi:MAG: hypothetical protein AAF456_13800 [Planctomycetota bacterium]
MQAPLLELLVGLESIGDQHEELYDSEVREQIGVAVMEGFVRAINGYHVPTDLGVLVPGIDAEVRVLLVRYIDAANAEAAKTGLTRFHDRLAAFQDPAVRTERGKDYDDFFGHTPPDYYDDHGDVLWDRVR